MLATAFSILCAIAGWYYMFYSRAAGALAAIEAKHSNHRRVILRRLGGLAMFLLGIFFYAGFYAVDPERPGVAFYLIWITVLFLLLVITILGAVDLTMTVRLRRRDRV